MCSSGVARTKSWGATEVVEDTDERDDLEEREGLEGATNPLVFSFITRFWAIRRVVFSCGVKR